jgi:hypothetical protein
VAAGKFFNVQSKTIFRHASLKLEWKKPVMAASENAGRNIRPAVERKRCSEERVNGLLIARCCQRGKHIGR